MSVMGEGSKRVYSASLSRVVYPAWPCQASRYGGARKDRLILLCLLGWTAAYLSQLYSLCPFWSLKSSIFTCKAGKFQHDGIHSPVYSLSLMLTALPTASIKKGQPCATLNSCSRLPNSSINPGLKPNPNQQNTCYHGAEKVDILSVSRKEPPDIRFATSPMHPRISGRRTSRRTNGFPRTQTSPWEDWYQLCWETSWSNP